MGREDQDLRAMICGSFFPCIRPGKVENQTVLPFVWIHRNADIHQHSHPQRNSYTHMDWHRARTTGLWAHTGTHTDLNTHAEHISASLHSRV